MKERSMLKNSSTTFGSVAKFFHWGIGGMIIGMLAFGFMMSDMAPSPEKWAFYGIHKSFGVVLLILIPVRLLWRISNPVPPVQPYGSQFLTFLAHASVYVLYLLMFGMVISGFVMSSAGGYGVSFFNLFTLPDLPKHLELSAFANTLHGYLAYVFVVALIAHVAAALYHHFVLKDAVLVRMLPLRKK